LVADHIRGQIVWGTEGNSQAAADKFFSELGESRSKAIEVISLDMGPGYAKSAREHAPQAIIAIDPFHVVALANRALDEVRRGYWNELRRLGNRDAARRFKDARWSLLKAPKNLNDKQASTLRRLKAAGGEVWRGYMLKEALRAIFQPGLTVDDVALLLDRFISRAARSRLAPFVRLGQTIRKHRDGILNAIRLGINQGRTEALNNKVRLITRRAYGFHSPQPRSRSCCSPAGRSPSNHHTNYTPEPDSPHRCRESPKSAVARPEDRHFLGFRLRVDPHTGTVEVLLSERTKRNAMERVRQLTPRTWGSSLFAGIAQINAWLRGWHGFFGIASVSEMQFMRKLDAHIRRRLRAIQLRHWKRKRTIARNLVKLGVPRRSAWRQVYRGHRSWWALSYIPAVDHGLNRAFFTERGLVALVEMHHRAHQHISAPASPQMALWG
ncbi:MAG: transposase, partial [Solirubrobacteraceae bacterium]